MTTYRVDPSNPAHQLPLLLATILRYEDAAPAEIVRLDGIDPMGATKAAYEGNWDWITTAANQVIDGEDPSEALALHTAWEPTGAALLQAVRKQLDIRKAEAVNNAAENIILALREKVFEPNLERLLDLSDDVVPGDTVDAAIRQEQYDKVAKIKEAERAARALTQLDTLRKMMHPGAFHWTAAFTREADGLEVVEDSTTPGGLGWWLTLIAGGATLHYPTLSEALKLHNSEEHKEYRQAKEAAEAEENPWEGIATGDRVTFARTN